MARDREIEAHIAEVDLFRGLSKSQVRRLAGTAKEVTHAAGRSVSTEGLGGLAFHYILEGRATVSRDGEELRTLGPGDYFGEISMIDGRPRSATVDRASASRRRAHRTFRICRAKSGSLSSTASNSWCGIASTFSGSAAVTVAERGRPSIMLISPK